VFVVHVHELQPLAISGGVELSAHWLRPDTRVCVLGESCCHASSRYKRRTRLWCTIQPFHMSMQFAIR